MTTTTTAPDWYASVALFPTADAYVARCRELGAHLFDPLPSWARNEITARWRARWREARYHVIERVAV